MIMINKELPLDEIKNISGGVDENMELIHPVNPPLPTFDEGTPISATEDGCLNLQTQDDPNHIKALYRGLMTCVDLVGSFFKGLGDP